MGSTFILCGAADVCITPTTAERSVQGLEHRTEAVLRHWTAVLRPFEGDAPWEVAHYILAVGPSAQVRCKGGDVSAFRYLCCIAQGRNGRPLFVSRDHGGTTPDTDHTPQFAYQDHEHQMLAIISESHSGGEPPAGVARQAWQQIMIGLVEEFPPHDREPSWTLICYVRYGAHLPLEEREKLSRIDSMARDLLIRLDRGAGACHGAHARHALAVLYRSPVWPSLEKKLRAAILTCLQNAAQLFVPSPIKPTGAKSVVSIPTGPTSTGICRRRFAETLESLDVLGHELGWLSIYLSDHEVHSEQMTGLLQTLLSDLEALSGFDLPNNGATCHALHGLRSMFERRVAQRKQHEDSEQ